VNVFNSDLDYYRIIRAIKDRDPQKFLYTIEFFPKRENTIWMAIDPAASP